MRLLVSDKANASNLGNVLNEMGESEEATARFPAIRKGLITSCRLLQRLAQRDVVRHDPDQISVAIQAQRRKVISQFCVFAVWPGNGDRSDGIAGFRCRVRGIEYATVRQKDVQVCRVA